MPSARVRFLASVCAWTQSSALLPVRRAPSGSRSLFLVAFLALALLAAVRGHLPGASLARLIADRILCAARLDGHCNSDEELAAAYGHRLAGLVRKHAPSIAYENGMAALPVDFRSCRDTACSAGAAEGIVTASLDGEPVTAFVHVVEHGGATYLQYWLYYPDSATLRGVPVAGRRDFTRMTGSAFNPVAHARPDPSSQSASGAAPIYCAPYRSPARRRSSTSTRPKPRRISLRSSCSSCTILPSKSSIGRPAALRSSAASTLSAAAIRMIISSGGWSMLAILDAREIASAHWQPSCQLPLCEPPSRRRSLRKDRRRQRHARHHSRHVWRAWLEDRSLLCRRELRCPDHARSIPRDW